MRTWFWNIIRDNYTSPRLLRDELAKAFATREQEAFEAGYRAGWGWPGQRTPSELYVRAAWDAYERLRRVTDSDTKEE